MTNQIDEWYPQWHTCRRHWLVEVAIELLFAFLFDKHGRRGAVTGIRRADWVLTALPASLVAQMTRQTRPKSKKFCKSAKEELPDSKAYLDFFFLPDCSWLLMTFRLIFTFVPSTATSSPVSDDGSSSPSEVPDWKHRITLLEGLST